MGGYAFHAFSGDFWVNMIEHHSAYAPLQGSTGQGDSWDTVHEGADPRHLPNTWLITQGNSDPAIAFIAIFPIPIRGPLAEAQA